MKLSAKSRYAMQAMLHLAEYEQDGPQSLTRITEAGMPRDYVEQLLGVLRRSGLIKSMRGAAGGYFLSRPKEEITLGQVIVAIEGPIAVCDCVEDAKTCEQSEQCKLRSAFVHLNNGITDLLASYTLKDLLQDNSQSLKGMLTD